MRSLAYIIFCDLIIRIISIKSSNYFVAELCPYFREGPTLFVSDLVGSWMTVYTQPISVSCFILHIRATTDLERERCLMKYGNFSGRVEWSKCLLELESPLGKHYLQGNGSLSGLLENVIIIESKKGYYSLYDQIADQWSMFGRRGSELLLMRDCLGEAVAVFARAPYWPGPSDLYAVLHRSGAPLTQGRVLCEPLDSAAQRSLKNFLPDKISNRQSD